ncbi:MAG: phosphosulfolactate synthase [Crocinitomicaceae bacterium]|nr:phosphosulfolactate synthase [Crocinitomicaceae bacterium]
MNFTLNHLPERTRKNRSYGLTMVMDKALSIRQAQDLIESSGEFVDIVKLGFGTSAFAPNVKEKVKLYQDNNIRVYVGGTLFEAFYVRGQVDDYRRYIDSLGLNTIEVSDGSIALPHDEKCNLIARFAKDYTVLSEVGSKEEGILISPAKWIKMMQNELKAGSWKVIAEARESGTVGIYRPNGQAHVVLINKILQKIKAEDILWEAPKKAQQVYFIKQLGPNVNLGNIAENEVIPLECLRIGLRGDTFFDYLPENIVDEMKG